MGKPTVQLPDLPDTWDIDPSSIPGLDQNPNTVAQTASDAASGDGGSPDFILPDGRRLGTVIQQRRAALQDGMAQLQNDPLSLDSGLGYAAGQYAATVWPHGPMDFKNQYQGQGDPDQLARAGNFAYYAIGSGIFPDAMLDAGATGYHLYKTMTDQNRKDQSSPFGPDASAQSVRDRALAFGASLK
ncbi:MAG TPA: hypothetical protein VHC39_16295 [Rhizomicrobium sp.]|nr:hypothetical protein [Rhizomicrobium sp.]